MPDPPRTGGKSLTYTKKIMEKQGVTKKGLPMKKVRSRKKLPSKKGMKSVQPKKFDPSQEQMKIWKKNEKKLEKKAGGSRKRKHPKGWNATDREGVKSQLHSRYLDVKPHRQRYKVRLSTKTGKRTPQSLKRHEQYLKRKK
jgi:hypothetical protein